MKFMLPIVSPREECSIDTTIAIQELIGDKPVFWSEQCFKKAMETCDHIRHEPLIVMSWQASKEYGSTTIILERREDILKGQVLYLVLDLVENNMFYHSKGVYGKKEALVIINGSEILIS